MSALSQLTNKSTLDMINQDVQEKTCQDLFDKNQEISLQLKNAATRYLQKANLINERVNKIEEISKIQQKRRHSFKNYETMKAYIRDKKRIQKFLQGTKIKELYSEAFKFQEVLNKTLGQEIQMIYVYEKNGVPELYKIKSEDILSFKMTSKHKIAGSYSLNQKQLQDANLLQKISLDNAELNFDLDNLNLTYKTVLERYRAIKSSTLKKYLVIWEYPEHQWKVQTVGSEGDLNETYANIIILNQPNPTFQGGTLNKYIDDFMEKVAQVDSISGLLQGDISKNGIEYGIKSKGAQTLGLPQIYDLANQIVMTPNFSIEELKAKKELFAEKGALKNLPQVIDNTVLEELKNIVTNI